MAYLTLGSSEQLVIKVPTPGSVGWADTMRTDTFLKIAQHDHTGSGSGVQIATGAIATDAVTDTKILLANNAYLRGTDNGGSDINILKVDTSNRIVLGSVTTLLPSVTVPDAAVILADDNSVASTAGIVTLATDESCSIHYKLVRNGVTQSGILRFTDVETIPSESYTGTTVGVTFSVSSGELFYTSTSQSSQTIDMTYVLVKE